LRLRRADGGARLRRALPLGEAAADLALDLRAGDVADDVELRSARAQPGRRVGAAVVERHRLRRRLGDDAAQRVLGTVEDRARDAAADARRRALGLTRARHLL